MPVKLLILGGTREAYELAELLVSEFSSEQLSVITSLAGVTGNPKLPAGEVRIGGFSEAYDAGGKFGLRKYLLQEKISLLVNATHPYAIQISENSLAAATELGLPYLRLTRPPWEKHSGDQWIEVTDMGAAADYLNSEFLNSNSGISKNIVFLTTGNRGLELFQQCRECHFVVRTVDVPENVVSENGTPAWPDAIFLQARGPFITLLVTKNSGGDSTYAKIEAASKLEIPVLMVDRPEENLSNACWKVNQVLDWVVQNKSV